jgi:hypothetical protein
MRKIATETNDKYVKTEMTLPSRSPKRRSRTPGSSIYNKKFKLFAG